MLIFVFVVGACIGVCSGAARTPHLRVVPLVASLMLALCAALTLYLLNPAGLSEALMYLLGLLAGCLVYSGAQWRALLVADRGLSDAEVYWLAFMRPSFLRYLLSQQAGAEREEPGTGAD